MVKQRMIRKPVSQLLWQYQWRSRGGSSPSSPPPPIVLRFYILAIYNNYEQLTFHTKYKPMASRLNLAVYLQRSMLTVVCSYVRPRAPMQVEVLSGRGQNFRHARLFLYT